MFPGGTVFPEGLAVGSSFDLDLVKSIYATAAAEARAVGIHMLSTLVMEVDRDPRMGRNEEAYTEDPYLYMRIGETIVRATQGYDISAPDKVIAVLTDFPTQSEPASGLERGAIEVSDRSLRENFMPPWIGAITKAGGLGVMAGYPEVEDVPSHASVKWMNDVLRQEIGFKGVVESEGHGFRTMQYEHIVPTQKEAGLLGLDGRRRPEYHLRTRLHGAAGRERGRGPSPHGAGGSRSAQGSGTEVPPGTLRESLC